MADVGFTATQDGIGSRITRGDGLRSTTAGGTCLLVLVGYGLQVTHGDQHGFLGGGLQPTVGGLLSQHILGV